MHELQTKLSTTIKNCIFPQNMFEDLEKCCAINKLMNSS